MPLPALRKAAFGALALLTLTGGLTGPAVADPLNATGVERPERRLAPVTAAAGGVAAVGLRDLRTSFRTAAATAHADQVKLIATTRPGAEQADLARAMAPLGEVAETSSRRQVAVVVPVERQPQTMAALRATAGVRSVRVAYPMQTFDVPNDPRYASAQAPYLRAVRAPSAWSIGRGGPGVRIAIIDTGVKVAHEDLTGRVVGRHNAVTGSMRVHDNEGHGTAVASMAAAATDNRTGMAAAAWHADILAVKVANDRGEIWTDAVAAGIRWATDHGDADVINMSLGGPRQGRQLRNAVAAANAAGVVVVAAAGNEGNSTKQYPGASEGVIAVGATTQSGKARASFSTYGSWVDVAAPGVNIVGADAGDADGYLVGDGTSFAAPLVAGQAALLIARKPTWSRARVHSAITGTATKPALGFARGLVDFAAAMERTVDYPAPAITSPGQGSTVSGAVTLRAQSSAPQVRFKLGTTGLSWVAPASGGEAQALVETFGVSGAQRLTAVGCVNATCSPNVASVNVEVANARPTLTAPVDGETAGVSVEAAAEAPGGAVRFTVGGKNAVVDRSAPYSAILSTDGLPNGDHAVRAVQCDSSGTVCGGAVSARVTVTVERLHPSITSVAPSPFSPNGDGRRDSATVRYRLDARQDVRLRVLDRSGDVVFAKSLGERLSAKAHEYTWKGKDEAGRAVRGGSYVIELVTTKGSLAGHAAGRVTVDVTKPGLAKARASEKTVFPVRDGYRDKVAFSVRTSERVGSLRLELLKGGERIRTLDLRAEPEGKAAEKWDGRLRNGSVVAGKYKWRWVATDEAGNQRASDKRRLKVSAKRLVKESIAKRVTAYGSALGQLSGACSEVFGGARGWPKGLSYASMYYCSDTRNDADLAAAIHRLKLPRAVRYGSVKVSAHGRGRSGGKARMFYLDPSGNVVEASVTKLGSTTDDYGAPAVKAGRVLDGRRVLWMVAAVGGNWYDVKDFTVRHSYYRLT